MIESQDLNFEGQRVLVTGAAGGIGSAMAEAFLGHGAKLILADVDGNALENQAKEIGSDVEFHEYDQGNAASIAGLAKAADPVDVLCNNAGIIEAGPILEQSPDIIQKLITIDLVGPILMARHVGEGMVARGRGVIVNTASQLAFHGSATRAAYAAAKAGLAQFTKSAAAEWAPHGVRVVALGPGRTLTPMTEPFLSTEKQRQDGLKHIPIGRYGNREEMGKLAVFLASNVASYVVGETLVADGGYVLL